MSLDSICSKIVRKKCSLETKIILYMYVKPKITHSLYTSNEHVELSLKETKMAHSEQAHSTGRLEIPCALRGYPEGGVPYQLM